MEKVDGVESIGYANFAMHFLKPRVEFGNGMEEDTPRHLKYISYLL